MAGCDYRSCDQCGSKTFYDANLNYELLPAADDERRVAEAGNRERYGYAVDWLGDWAVLCSECAKTYRTAIVAKESSDG